MLGIIKTEKSFPEVLAEVQSVMAEKYAVLLSLPDLSERKEELKNYIKKALEDKKLTCQGMTQDSLIEALYKEMAEYSFLTNYLYNKEVEEININRWNDIKVNYTDGSMRPAAERFRSPQHALDVIKKLLRPSGMILDASQPTVRGHLNGNIRITAYAPPVIDSDAGVAASIRIVNPKQYGKRDLISFGTLTEEMYDFLLMCCLAKVSQGYAGEPGSGKTTLMSSIMEELLKIQPTFRLYTIENETREFNLVKTDTAGNVINNVVHLVTRKSNDPKLDVSQENLLELCLTSNPNGICVAEMKSAEAFAAQEAARTGLLVLTTTHSNSAIGTYSRMGTLCRMKYNLEYEILYDLITEAFPISVYAQLIPGTDKRRIIEIGEMTILPDRKRVFRSLWKYQAASDSYQKVQPISDFLRNKLRDGFIMEEEIARY